MDTSLKYISDISKNIPLEEFEISFLVLTCIIVIIFAFTQDICKLRFRILLSILIEYCFLVLSYTVIFRNTGEKRLYNLTPFWSYNAVAKYHEHFYFHEYVMNILLGMPIGFLLFYIFSKRKWLKVFVFGLVFSCIIEFLQYLLMKGLCEFDDVFHNTLGCMLGYGIGYLFLLIIKKKILE